MVSHEYPPNSFDPVVLRLQTVNDATEITSPPKPSIAWRGWKRRATLRWGSTEAAPCAMSAPSDWSGLAIFWSLYLPSCPCHRRVRMAHCSVPYKAQRDRRAALGKGARNEGLVSGQGTKRLGLRFRIWAVWTGRPHGVRLGPRRPAGRRPVSPR